MSPDKDVGRINKSDYSDNGYPRCPYYIDRGSWERKSIELRCEGIIPDTICKTRFKRNSDRKFHEDVYCKSQWESCEIAMAIQRYSYGEEENT